MLSRAAHRGGRELNLRSSCSSLMQKQPIFRLISKPFKRDRVLKLQNFTEE
jgi:hypothetical protein